MFFTYGIPSNTHNFANSLDDLKLNNIRLIVEGCAHNKWKSQKIAITSTDGKVSDTEKMRMFIQELSNELSKLKTAWEKMSKRMKKVLDNDDKTQWWGFDGKTKKSLQSLVASATTSINGWIEGFTNSICTALRTSENAVGLDLSALEALK